MKKSAGLLAPDGTLLPVPDEDMLFEQITEDLRTKGYSVRPNALPAELSEGLRIHAKTLSADHYLPAGIGREQDHHRNNFVRGDEICWIDGGSDIGRDWLDWTAGLQRYLNRQLFLGLFSFESHFAHYQPGAFYRRHVDAFKGEANRVLSLVLYLNPGWLTDDGGELVIYLPGGDSETLRVTPAFGTLVCFLSEEFPHEVLPATRDRYSIAGWFRVNSSTADKADPPR